MEFFNANKSLGFAVWQAIRVIRRSKSYTAFKYSRSSSLVIICSFSSSTASRRLEISAFSINGWSKKERIIRAPIAVFVLSNTQSREPRLDFSLNVSVSSKFRLVELSRTINFPVTYGWIADIWESEFFCVS